MNSWSLVKYEDKILGIILYRDMNESHTTEKYWGHKFRKFAKLRWSCVIVTNTHSRDLFSWSIFAETSIDLSFDKTLPVNDLRRVLTYLWIIVSLSYSKSRCASALLRDLLLKLIFEIVVLTSRARITQMESLGRNQSMCSIKCLEYDSNIHTNHAFANIKIFHQISRTSWFANENQLNVSTRLLS